MIFSQTVEFSWLIWQEWLVFKPSSLVAKGVGVWEFSVYFWSCIVKLLLYINSLTKITMKKNTSQKLIMVENSSSFVNSCKAKFCLCVPNLHQSNKTAQPTPLTLSSHFISCSIHSKHCYHMTFNITTNQSSRAEKKIYEII